MTRLTGKADLSEPPASANRAVILETQGLTRDFGKMTAVDSLSLSVEQGEVFGLLRPQWGG